MLLDLELETEVRLEVERDKERKLWYEALGLECKHGKGRARYGGDELEKTCNDRRTDGWMICGWETINKALVKNKGLVISAF